MRRNFSIKHKLSNSALSKTFHLLRQQDQLKLIIISLLQAFMGLLDLLGVVAIGAIGALSIQGIESKGAGDKVGKVLRILGIDHFSFRNQIAILALVATLIFILKTLGTIYFVRKTLYFLAYKASQISAELIEKVLFQNLVQLKKKSSQEILFIVSDGIKNLMVGILGTSINMAADLSTLLIISMGLFLIDPTVALSTSLIFCLFGFVLHRKLQVRASEVGSEFSILTIRSNEKILEVLSSYREAKVRNRRTYYSDEIRKIRYSLGNTTAEMNFQPFISKYVIESITIVGILVLSLFEFGTKNAVHAVATLAIFVGASSRIAPSILRLQQGLLIIRNSVGTAQQTFELLSETSSIHIIRDNNLVPTFDYVGFEPSINLKSVNFKYENSEYPAIKNINLFIPPGTSLALVGPSGAGKSTIVDLILGVLEPSSGIIEIDGLNPTLASTKFPGAMSYAPQDVFISNGTVRENVTLGYDFKMVSDQQVWDALETAQLTLTVRSLEGELDAKVGERGSRLSGGERQRLGIARALLSKPKLLVLDEATSALDGKSEASIGEAILKLSGAVTVIVVAHRLSTIRSFDKLAYIHDGEILAVGSFEELRLAIPDFDNQAKLMGL
jgi:ABC-type multidrug transport system fused ATPase/permease subunit